MKRLLLVACGVVATMLSGCLSGGEEPFVIEPFVFKSTSEMGACAQAADLDSAQLANALSGMWEWKHESCFWMPESASDTRHAGIVLEFRRNGTLRVHERDSLAVTTRWRLEESHDRHGVETDTPYVHFTAGITVMCGNAVLFYDSYIDGCDQWFHRTAK